MSVLKPRLALSGAAADANRDAWAELANDLDADLERAARGGDERSRERHLSRGKLLPRERVMRLIDPGSPFLELSPLAAHGLHGGDIHGAGVITGVVDSGNAFHPRYCSCRRVAP